jgi:hypothetical protein
MAAESSDAPNVATGLVRPADTRDVHMSRGIDETGLVDEIRLATAGADLASYG